MADIFREVDEDIRQERYEKLWKRYRWWLLGLAIALIGAVAAYVIIDERNESLRREEGLRFATALLALEEGRPKEAAAQFNALANSTDSGYLALARLRAADALAAAGDESAAVALYDELSSDNQANLRYRELSVLLAAEHLLDSAPPQEVMQRLAALVSGDGPWRSLAVELTGLAQIKAGRIDTARQIFDDLRRDLTAPSGVRARAQELLVSLGGPLESDSERPVPETSKD